MHDVWKCLTETCGKIDVPDECFATGLCPNLNQRKKKSRPEAALDFNGRWDLDRLSITLLRRRSLGNSLDFLLDYIEPDKQILGARFAYVRRPSQEDRPALYKAANVLVEFRRL